MTEQQAFEEAKDRWGRNVRVEKVCRKKKGRQVSSINTPKDIEYRVGMIKNRPRWGEVFDVRGIGKTWEEAFEYADRQKRLD